MTWKIVNHHDFSTPWTVTKRIAFPDFYQQKGETKKARSWEIRQFSSTPRLEISCCCLWELWLPEAELQCLTEWDAPEWFVNYCLPLCTNKEQRLHLNLNPNSFKKLVLVRWFWKKKDLKLCETQCRNARIYLPPINWQKCYLKNIPWNRCFMMVY